MTTDQVLGRAEQAARTFIHLAAGFFLLCVGVVLVKIVA